MGWFTQWGKLGTPNTRLLTLYLFTIEHDSVWLWCFFPFFFFVSQKDWRALHSKLQEDHPLLSKNYSVIKARILCQNHCSNWYYVDFQKALVAGLFLRIHIFCSFYWPLSRLLDILSPCTEHTYWIEKIFPIFRMRDLYFLSITTFSMPIV